MLRPINGRVTIRRDESATKQGSLYIPQKAQEKLYSGTVVAVADDVDEVKAGDRVIWGRYEEELYHIDGEQLCVVDAADIFGVIGG